MPVVLTAKRLVMDECIVERPLITLEDDRVLEISSREIAESPAITHDFGDATLTPGLLDIHMHGAIGHDVMEPNEDGLPAISAFLASRGVTEFLPTTVTASLDYTLQALARIARFVQKGPGEGRARATGIHMEGPFLSHAKRGMHPEQFLLPPTPELLDRFWEAAGGSLQLMTIAPEVPGALETIARAQALGIRVSLGHSQANQAETLRALEAGAASATHTYNAMRPLDHREPGILGTVLDRDDLYCDLICDGVHVAPELVRLWFKAKGPERAILITDSLEATGMPDGTYRLGETTVHVKEGRCVTDAGVLAGSILTLDEAVRRMQRFTGANLATAVRLASRNPARLLGLGQRAAIGMAADFNVYDTEGNRTATILRGRLPEESL